MDEHVRIKNDIAQNEAYLRETLGSGDEINYRHVFVPALGNIEALIVNVSGMYDKKEAEATIIAPLIERLKLPHPAAAKQNGARMLLESGIFTSAGKGSGDWTEICDAILAGSTALFLDKNDMALILDTRRFEHRANGELQSESETRGPKDGFTENIEKNIGLIRVRIKDTALRFDSLTVGTRTKTALRLAYIDNLVSKPILQELKTRIGRIDVDRVLESATIEEFIEDAPNSLVPQIQHTERPDTASTAILDGRIAILVENTPFVLMVPTVFWNFLHPVGDLYMRRFLATLERVVRFTSIFLALSLSSVYVLMTSYHQEMLPTTLAIRIAEGRSTVPFPAPIEAILLEFALLITREASLRMSQPTGQLVSIIGTFIIGQAAILAHLVGPVLVIFVSIEALCSYALPSQELSLSLRMFSLTLLISTSLLGLFGYLGGLIILSSHLLSIRSFGEPFLAPILPHYKGGGQDVFVRPPVWKMSRRPRFAHAADQETQPRRRLKPRPPAG